MAFDRERVIAESRAVLARHARSFDLAGRFLPPARRDAAAVVYAFCRAVDDAVDEAATRAEGASELSALERELRGEAPARPLVAYFGELLDGWRVPRGVALELITGVRSDLGAVEIAGDAELIRYCYRVAGTVGLMMCGVIGVRDASAFPHALDLGVAMQLTNVCRDVAEDARRGRVYLPAARLRARGVEPAALLAGEAPRAAAAAVVLDLLALAEEYYASAHAGMRWIPWPSRLAILVASRVYRAIGRKLRRAGGDALAGRTVVAPIEKLAWVGSALASFARSLVWPVAEDHDPTLHRWLADLPGADGRSVAPPGAGAAAPV